MEINTWLTEGLLLGTEITMIMIITRFGAPSHFYDTFFSQQRMEWMAGFVWMAE